MSKVIQSLKNEFNTPAWKRSLLVWLSLNVLLSGMGVLAWQMNSPIRPANLDNLWGASPIDEGLRGALEGVWLRWDAIHYFHIAQEGYNSEVVSAFLPLYPLLGRAAGWLLGGDELGGLLLVSRLAFLLALVLLYKMTAEKFGDEIATYASVFLALYPLGVYWLAPYPLSLALLLTLLSLRCATQKRWLAATLAGLAAGLAHGTTVPLALGLLSVWILQVRRQRRAWLLLPATASPLLGTALFLSWRIAHNLPDFNGLQAKYWTRVMQPPWMVISDFQRFFGSYMGHADGWTNLLLFLLALGMTVVVVRKLPVELGVYQTCLMVFLCSTAMYSTPFGSVGRFLMIAFPLFIAAALTIQGKKSRLATLTIGLFLLLFFAIVYFEWGWLA